MWPALMVAARTYAPFVVFPFAFIIGAIGYSIEGISTLFIPDNPFKSIFQLPYYKNWTDRNHFFGQFSSVIKVHVF